MTAKKKTELKVAPSPTSNEGAKSATPAEPLGVGDWTMLDGMFELLHLVAKPRVKELVTTACGLVVAPSFIKPNAQRCKRCNALRDVTAS